MPNESVTGIGGRDVSGDDPSLGGEYQGHPGLDEEEGKKGLYHNVNKRRKEGKPPKKPGDKGYPTDKAWKDSAKTAKESVEFVSDRGIRYVGHVVSKNSRHIVVEMHDGRRVSTRTGNPSLKKLSEATYEDELAQEIFGALNMNDLSSEYQEILIDAMETDRLEELKAWWNKRPSSRE